MEIYQGTINKQRLILPKGVNKNQKPEREMLDEIVGDKDFLVTFLKFGQLPFLAVYSPAVFDKVWAEFIRPDDWSEDVENVRRIIFPFSEYTKRESAGHVYFDRNSVRDLYGAERSADCSKLNGNIAAVRWGGRLFVYREEHQELYEKEISHMRSLKEPCDELTPKEIGDLYDNISSLQ